LLKLGLRARFFLYSNTVIAGTMSVATLLVAVHDRRQHYAATESRGRSIAQALAIPITNTLSRGDPTQVAEGGLTEDFISELAARNPDLVRYVIVMSSDGVVTHSSRPAQRGLRFEEAVGRSFVGIPPVAEVHDEKGKRLLEVREPLHAASEHWGWLVLGFSLEPVDRDFDVIASRLVLIALVVIVANSVLTAVYMETLIRPILSLHQVMKRAARGNLTVRAETRRSDEVGELGQAFNRMMDELEDARELEQVRQSQLAHTEKMAAVGTLAAGVAHEVNNPLGGILTCVENMKADPENREMRERYLDLIHDGMTRIERTVANLLGFSRQRGINPEPTSINHNLRHVTELVQFQARKAKVRIAFDLDPEEPQASADHFQMEQLFLNLVLNAIQAMPDGGLLTLRTRRAEGRVVAEVRDTGGGIPDSIRDRIFDPFFTTRDVGEGTGLGLTVSDSIVTAHGGRIEAQSLPGKGSVFRVSFPILEASTRRKES
jgi:two-component system NtrC family sensor kinase